MIQIQHALPRRHPRLLLSYRCMHTPASRWPPLRHGPCRRQLGPWPAPLATSGQQHRAAPHAWLRPPSSHALRPLPLACVASPRPSCTVAGASSSHTTAAARYRHLHVVLASPWAPRRCSPGLGCCMHHHFMLAAGFFSSVPHHCPLLQSLGSSTSTCRCNARTAAPQSQQRAPTNLAPPPPPNHSQSLACENQPDGWLALAMRNVAT